MQFSLISFTECILTQLDDVSITPESSSVHNALLSTPNTSAERVTQLLNDMVAYHSNKVRTHTYLHQFSVMARGLWALVEVSLGMHNGTIRLLR